MFALTLAALTALAASPALTPAEKLSAYNYTGVRLLDAVETEIKPTETGLWVVGGAVGGGLSAALAGQAMGKLFVDNNGRDHATEGMIVGSLVGFGAGYVAGYFAKKGYLAARIATIGLVVLAAVAVGVDVVAAYQDFASGKYNSNGGGWGPR